MNLIVFKSCLYESWNNIIRATVLSAIYFFIVYFIYGLAASLIQSRLSAAHDLFKRIGVILPVFYVLNIFQIAGFYFYYGNFNLINCRPGYENFWWAYSFGCFASTVVTLLNEAAVNWTKWKSTITETEQLRTAFQKSKLYGLKGQVNPHFLFNCFNTLSSLIHEDEKNAERFLAEMTRVHRYMLRTDDEQLVPLRNELEFAQSYLYLIKVRFGKAINISINVDQLIIQKELPPLSLQVILENIIYTNVATKSAPLSLQIFIRGNNLIIKNSIREKLLQKSAYFEEGLDNLITKYQLLGKKEIIVYESAVERTICLPLFAKIEESL